MSSKTDARRGRRVGGVCGVLALLLAAVVPASSWIGFLRDASGPLPAALAEGALLFRVSLAAVGAYLIVGGILGWWDGATESRQRVAAASPSRAQSGVALGLLVVGSVLRLFRLDEGMWNDEVVTLVESVRPPLGAILTTYPSQNHHILFSVLAHLSTATFGESVWALRLPAALFGMATLWAMWRFSLLVVPAREALLATALLTFSYQHIWFSQNARGYSALLFLSVVSSHLLVRGLRENGRGIWAGYAMVATLGMWAHLTMIFVVLGQFAAYGWHAARRRTLTASERLAPFFAGFVPAGLLTILCYAFVLPQIPAASAGDPSDVAVWRSPLWMLQELGRGMAGSLLPLAALAGAGVVGAGLVSFARQSATLPLLLIVPVVSGTVVMIGLGHHLWPRFFFFSAGFAILVVVRGIATWSETAGALLGWRPARSAWVATVAGLLVVMVLGRSLPYVYGPKQDYEGAVRAVEAERRPGDAVVVVGGGATALRMYFAPEWPSISTLDELRRVRAEHPRTWLVFTLPIEVENSYPEIYRSAQEDFHLFAVFEGTLNGGDVYVYRADGPEAANSAAATTTRQGT